MLYMVLLVVRAHLLEIAAKNPTDNVRSLLLKYRALIDS